MTPIAPLSVPSLHKYAESLTQRTLTVRNSHIHIMLFAILVDAEAFKVYVAARAKLWLDRTRDIDRGLETQVGHAILNHLEVDGDDASHLDSTTE